MRALDFEDRSLFTKFPTRPGHDNILTVGWLLVMALRRVAVPCEAADTATLGEFHGPSATV